ncbi:MAG: ASCH domain-containing protein [Pirellulales bacterium]|nr:ASCH domain-containing protein [Pirellulales bacterium]
MLMLLFKKKFLDAIRAGRKTQTIRLWKVRRVRAGQRSYIPGVGYIWIRAVDEVALDELTDEDAVLDGFDNARALRAEIDAIYAEQLDAGYRAYRLRFELAPDEVKKPKPESAKQNRATAKRPRRDDRSQQRVTDC